MSKADVEKALGSTASCPECERIATWLADRDGLAEGDAPLSEKVSRLIEALLEVATMACLREAVANSERKYPTPPGAR